jgi:hypothetical protein
MLPNVFCLGCSPDVQRLLNEVVATLPQEVQRFVGNNVCFIVVGPSHGHGQTWHRRDLRPAQHWGEEPGMADWIITLSDDGMTRHTVAHEIAHAFQAHNGEGPEVEAEADRLASEWLSQK